MLNIVHRESAAWMAKAGKVRAQCAYGWGLGARGAAAIGLIDLPHHRGRSRRGPGLDQVLGSCAWGAWLPRCVLGSVGLPEAIKASGLANAWAQLVVAAGKRVAFGHPIGILLALSFISSVLANLMSHTATAALMAPIAMKVCMAESMQLDKNTARNNPCHVSVRG